MSTPRDALFELITHWRRQSDLGGPDTFRHCADELEQAVGVDDAKCPGCHEEADHLLIYCPRAGVPDEYRLRAATDYMDYIQDADKEQQHD